MPRLARTPMGPARLSGLGLRRQHHTILTLWSLGSGGTICAGKPERWATECRHGKQAGQNDLGRGRSQRPKFCSKLMSTGQHSFWEPQSHRTGMFSAPTTSIVSQTPPVIPTADTGRILSTGACKFLPHLTSQQPSFQTPSVSGFPLLRWLRPAQMDDLRASSSLV